LDESLSELLEQMWCYVTRDPDVKTNMQLTSKHSSRNAAARGSRRLLACALAWVCLAAAAVPLAASAQSAVDAGPEMSLVFTAETARLVGSSALVPVRCLGPQEGLCSGTVTLSVKGRKHKAPFSLVGGSAQNLVVPVGGALAGQRAVAVARTARAIVGYARATSAMRFVQ